MLLLLALLCCGWMVDCWIHLLAYSLACLLAWMLGCSDAWKEWIQISSSQVTKVKTKSRIQERISQFSAKTGNILVVVSMKGWMNCLLMVLCFALLFKNKSDFSLGFGKPIRKMHETEELDHGHCPCRYFFPPCKLWRVDYEILKKIWVFTQDEVMGITTPRR